MTSTQGITIVLHPVTNLEKAKPIYAALLGVEPSADSSYYVGFDTAGQHIGLVPNSKMSAPVAYWQVDDLDAKLAEVTAAGGAVQEKPHEVGPGRRVATFTDPDNNVLGLVQDS